jgi:hypothetical protein
MGRSVGNRPGVGNDDADGVHSAREAIAGRTASLMDGGRTSLIVPGTTLLASLALGVFYAIHRARELAERWTPRGVSVLPLVFVLVTSVSYVVDGGTLTQPPPYGTPPGEAPRGQVALPAPSPGPVATPGVPDYALPRRGLDITYDFGPPGSPHPIPGPGTSAATTAQPGPAPSSPPPRRSPIPPLPPLPRPPPPLPPLPVP